MLREKYPDDFMGKILLEILKHHFDKETLYTLDPEADELYETIYDKYSGQFNMKYSGKKMSGFLHFESWKMCLYSWHQYTIHATHFLKKKPSHLPNKPSTRSFSDERFWLLIFVGGTEIFSQETLDESEKSEISVRTKAPELIGRLATNLWIYCNGT